MAPSLQVLIDFLLAEIALCGDQGKVPEGRNGSMHYCKVHVLIYVKWSRQTGLTGRFRCLCW